MPMRGRRNVDIHMDVELSIQLSENRNALLNGRGDVGSNGDIERRVYHALVGFGQFAFYTLLFLCLLMYKLKNGI